MHVPLSGGASNNFIHSENHLGGLGSGQQGLLLDSEALSDSEGLHVGDLSLEHVEAGGDVSSVDLASEVLDELSRVVPSVVGDDGGQLSQSVGVRLYGEGLLSLDGLGELVNGQRHSDLRVAASVEDSGLLDGGNEHADSVVHTPLSFVEDVGSRSPQDNAAGFSSLAARELDDLVLSDHDLFDERAASEEGGVGGVEGGEDVGAEDGGESFSAIEVGVLDDHDAFLSEELLGVVVDELSVDEDVGLVGNDLVDLPLHLQLLGLFDLGDLHHGVDLHLGSENLDFVVVHGGVGDEDLGVFFPLGAARGDGLLQDEAVGQEGVLEGATRLLDKFNVVEVAGPLESEYGLDSEVSEVLSIL